MLSKITKFIVLVLALAIITPNLAQAAKKYKYHCTQRYAYLNLSKTQHKQVERISKKFSQNKSRSKARIHKTKNRMNLALQAGDADQKILDLNTQLQGEKTWIGQLKVDKALAIRAILTPDQVKIYKGFAKRHSYKKKLQKKSCKKKSYGEKCCCQNKTGCQKKNCCQKKASCQNKTSCQKKNCSKKHNDKKQCAYQAKK